MTGKRKFSTTEDSVNPFEQRFTTRKHKVLNRKVKGSRGNPGESRKTGLQHREKSSALANTKAGSFSDKRFGENNTDMSLDDKLMARYVAEKKSRSQQFNIDDGGSEDELALTHFGQSLSTMPDEMFNKRPMSDDEEGHGGLDKHTVNAANFGGFMDERDPDRKKSKNEIMQEIIQKSKFHKDERRRMRDANEELMDDVDAELDDIRGLLNPGRPAKKEFIEKTDYDVLVKELGFEKRGKPSDRLKTDQELATEAKEKLERLEVFILIISNRFSARAS
jgi:nucleolar protein 14